MDQHQNSFPGMQHIPLAAGNMPEYWNNLDPNSMQLPSPHPQQQPAQTQSVPHPSQQPQPVGISWDHPVFHQQNQVVPRQDQDHGIYSPAPQSWHPNPLDSRMISTPPQGFGVAPQYQQVRHYSQGHASFDPQSMTPSETPPITQYSFPHHYYPSAQVPMQDGYSQSTPIQSVQSPAPQVTQYQASAHHPPAGQYAMPPRYPEESSHTPIQLSNGFVPGSNIPDHRTINPQFLNTPHHSTNLQQPPQENKFLYMTPAEFERRKLLNAYQQGPQVPPTVYQPATGQPGTPAVLTQKRLAPKGQVQPPVKKAKVKTVGKRPDASSPSESSSDESDSDLEIQEADEPSPIPATRPSDPIAAAEYDTLRAVWSPRNKPPPVDKVKDALVAFKEVVKAVRDTWKESTQAMKMAENKDENDKAARFKEEVVLQRRVINAVVSTTLEKGHPKIVEKLGEHPIAVSALYSFLLDRHQACDNDGELTVNILKLLGRFSTLDEDILQKTYVAKLLPRFIKKGGQTVKDLSQKIINNAAAATRRKQEKSVSPPPAKRAAATNGASTNKDRNDVAGTKRPRETETNGLPGSKRMLVSSQTKNNTQKSTTAVNGSAKRPQETGQETKPTGVTHRPKANIVAPKPTSLFGSLSSASKRPGTSNSERAAALAAKASGNSPEKKGTPPPKPAFSFGDLMADLNRQKDSPSAEPTEEKPPETPEESERRLRKEKRRKLRVSWKPESTLTEVRYFTHDPEEELGPGDRAAGDVKGEGSVLKLHRDLDELDDEDEGGVREETLREYRPATEIDLGNESNNFIKRGGSQQPTSPEKEAQDHREATTLMVFYTSQSDVPSSPKEPPAPDPDEMVPDVLGFGELPDLVKARQDRYYNAIKPTPPPASQPPTQTNQFDISNLLKAIQGTSQPQQPTPPPPPVSQPPVSDLERTINMFKQQQPQQPQFPQFQPQAQPAANVDLQKILAIVNAQQQMNQPPAFQQPVSQPMSQPAVAPNFAALLSQLSNQNQAGPQQGGPFHEDPERKRMRDRDPYEDAFDDRFNPAKRHKQPGLMKHPKAGLIPCRYWKEGKCIKGDECTFRHDPR